MAGPPNLAGVEIAARGKKIYREKIRPLMTESDIGKYVIVDVYSGDYEIDEWRVEADIRLRARGPTLAATYRKPLAPIAILDSIGNPHALRVILDTGFTGQSLLPERYMRRLGLEMDGYSDGRATFIWQGRRRNVEVLQYHR